MKKNWILILSILAVFAVLVMKLQGFNDRDYRDSDDWNLDYFADDHNAYKPIVLPEAAHNTIGQIPLIEHFDDGDLGGRSGYGNQSMCTVMTVDIMNGRGWGVTFVEEK